MAIGARADVANGRFRSVAIGPDAVATQDNQIVLGNQAANIYIPGDLIVDGTITENVAGKKRLAEVVEQQQTEITAQAGQIKAQQQIADNQQLRIKELQTQIENQQKLLLQQQLQIDALKKSMCQSNPQAGVCQ